MAICENSAGCLFFNDKMSGMPTIANKLKKAYCENNKNGCARYMVKSMFIKGYTFKSDAESESLEPVLKTLFPNDQETAREIISRMVH